VRVTRIFEGANDVLLTHMGAIETTAPLARPPAADHPDDPLAAAADRLAATVAGRLRALVERHGVRLMSRPRLLHRLGRLVVLREAADAVCADAAARPDAAPLAAVFLELAERRARLLLDEPLSDAALAAADLILGRTP
jgi:hypothetical protein